MFRNLQLKSLLLMGALLLQNQLGAQNSCATGAPPAEWDSWFNEKVKEQAQKMLSGKSAVVNRTIPVIVHIIHFGETSGTFPNIDSNQVISQIEALNRDFSGQGDNLNNIPGAFSNVVSNTGIQFCRATVDYSGTAMVEQGINRVSAASNNWESPSTPTLNLQNYFNTTIIPATIWDPQKFLNIWVSDRPTGSTILSFGTYPPSSGQIGLFGGQVGTPTNDGIWVYARAFGTTGDVQAPTDMGRTATHQIGHWLGLRHIWGDGNCLSDYVADTPPQKGPTQGCPSGITTPDICGINQSPNGNMYMNFMDDTEDACKYMFTHDQSLRMHTALNQSPQRNLLGTHGQCQSLPVPPTSSAVASFSFPGVPCLNGPVMPDNRSSGYPYPSYLWSSSPPAAFLPNNTSSHPFINFSNPGTYVITLVATNSLSSSSYSTQVSVQFSCAPASLCLDSLKMIPSTDSLAAYDAPISSQVSACGSSPTGNLAGNNCYGDKEVAQYFPASTYTGMNYPQVNSVIILFDSAGTAPGGAVRCRIYGGTATGGPVGQMGSLKQELLSNITASPKVVSVSYLGKSGAAIPGRQIIPYRFDFDKPIIITSPASGFFAGLEFPSYPNSVNVLTNSRYNNSTDSSAWFRNYNNSWKTFRHDRGMKVHLAIIPQISCSPLTGIDDAGALESGNVNLMPNPGSGDFNLLLNFSREEKQINIRVYNFLGKELMTTELENVTSHMLQINMNDYSEGIYFVEVNNGSGKLVKKLILQR